MLALLLEWLAATPVAAALRTSAVLYLLVNAAHIMSIGLLIGSILPLDLRLLGCFRSVPLAVIGPFLSRAAFVGACMAILTGLALFTVRPAEYAANPAFLTKMALLAIGAANALALHFGEGWKLALASGVAGARVRLAAFISFAGWIGAVIAGRWIGFL